MSVEYHQVKEKVKPNKIVPFLGKNPARGIMLHWPYPAAKSSRLGWMSYYVINVCFIAIHNFSTGRLVAGKILVFDSNFYLCATGTQVFNPLTAGVAYMRVFIFY